MLRLANFCVTELFGEFNHEIPFNQAERVTALIGPNGLGKTACLRIINALFRKQWSVLAAIDFKEAVFIFDDGSKISICHVDGADTETEVSDTLGIRVTTQVANGETQEPWSPRFIEESMNRGSRIDHYLPFLTRIGPRSWRHDHTRQSYSLQEIMETFSEQLPHHITSSFSSNPPSVLSDIIRQIDCHLIETQRLLIFQQDDVRRPSSSLSTLAISRKAHALKTIIAKALADYAATSQSLDRSFPRRVLQLGPMKPSEDIRANLADLEKLRSGLAEAGILDQEADDALPPIENLDSAIAAVLSVYIEDTTTKLSVLTGLRERILLFIELIDKRFTPKTVVVDKDVGFSVRRSSEVDVPLEKLSSGEQHQLVLFFELLFELDENALILIDEPELSLHISWQKQFISDLKRIISLNTFDVLLATHSPQLVGEWGRLVVELGDVDPL